MQEALFPTFALYNLRLLLELGARRSTLPAYLGSTIRGVFAAAFRQAVCVTRAPVCDGCLLLRRCPYPYIFETPPTLTQPIALQKRFQQAPRPYVFEVPVVYDGAETLELGLVLVGQASAFLPYFIYVVQTTGAQGLGRARVPYRLLKVTDGGHPDHALIFHADTGIVRDQVQAMTLASVQHPNDVHVQQITLAFLTPLRIKKYGAYQTNSTRLDFATLLDLLLGRLEALSLFHCDGAWTPNAALRDAARHVHIIDKHFTWQRLERYSNRQHQKLPLDGIVGSISFAGELAAFLPLLRLGEYLHVGAGTAFGLGQYRLIPTPVS